MENKVNQRVIEFLKFKNISKNRFCDMVNVSYTTFSSAILQDRNLNLDIILSLFNEFSDINPDWLLLGNGKMLRETVNNPGINESDLTKYMLQRIEDLIKENTELKYQLKEKK